MFHKNVVLSSLRSCPPFQCAWSETCVRFVLPSIEEEGPRQVANKTNHSHVIYMWLMSRLSGFTFHFPLLRNYLHAKDAKSKWIIFKCHRRNPSNKFSEDIPIKADPNIPYKRARHPWELGLAVIGVF